MGNGTTAALKTTIDRSVGRFGRNKLDDYITILELLKQVPVGRGGLGKPDVDVSKLNVKGNKFYDAIRDFQMFHFGVANGRIDPGNMTISELVKEVTGKRPPGKIFMSAATFKAMVRKLRDEIVRQATAEALRPDRPRGVAKNAPEGTRPANQAARLKEYFKAFNQKPKPSEYTMAKPGGYSYCGIFATWVVNQALQKTGFIGKLEFHMGGKIFYNPGGSQSTMTRRKFFQDGKQGPDLVNMNSVTYSKGDICLVKEVPEEKHPTHHFIVAEEPRPGANFKTVEGNFADNGLWHGVTDKNTRQVLNYGYLSVLQPETM